LVELPLRFLAPQPLDLEFLGSRRELDFQFVDAGLGRWIWKRVVDFL
jgi:hypothetical protein